MAQNRSQSYKANPSTNLELIRGQKSWDLLLFFTINDLNTALREFYNIGDSEPIHLSRKLLQIYGQIVQIEFMCNYVMCRSFKIRRDEFIETIQKYENYNRMKNKSKTIELPKLPEPRMKYPDVEIIAKIKLRMQKYFKYRVSISEVSNVSQNPTSYNVLLIRERFHFWVIMLDEYLKQMKSLSEENIAMGQGMVDFE